MFCPKCATQNLEGASFCRVCGANISLVPQALAGELAKPEVAEADCSVGRRGRRRELTLENTFKNFFIGVAFLLIAIGLSRSIGVGWWFWLLIPAFSLMATGLAQYIRLKEQKNQGSLPGQNSRAFTTQVPRQTLRDSTRNTGELQYPPASVTEGTTRHLGAEGQTRHLDEKVQ